MFDYCYIAIDLKSFYASVECADRGLDPLTTNLVVADARRTEKTICLAVSPSLKSYGIGGRARLFEVVQRVREINADRLRMARRLKPTSSNASSSVPSGVLPFADDCTGRNLGAYRAFEQTLFTSASYDNTVVASHPKVELDFLIARPRMAKYIEVSTRIYEVYLKYFAPEDIHVYSIDEVFIDASRYANVHRMDIKTLASTVISDVLATTGITATAGIGTNLYLAKVALDVLAKHENPDENGVRIALLDEQAYKQRIWPHRPLTDIWRIGAGYARKLEAHGMHTMGDVARCSLGARSDARNEDLLFKLFGKNAELLIDHAWGYEPVTMREIKAYKPAVNCKTMGQVLQRAYDVEKARLVAWEMADQLAFDLLAEGLTTDKLTLTIGYDRSCAEGAGAVSAYRGPVVADRYGRLVPKPAHGTTNVRALTASSRIITQAVLDLYDRIVDPCLLVRRINVSAERVVSQEIADQAKTSGQMTLFDFDAECGAAVSKVGTSPNRNAKSKNEPGGLFDASYRVDGFDSSDTRKARATATAGNRTTDAALEKERCLHDAMLDVRSKFGKNAVLRAANLQEGATARQRNNQIGGHSA